MNRRQMVTTLALGGAILAVGQRPDHRSSALAGGWASLELINPLRVVVVGVPAVIDAQYLVHGVRPAASPGAIKFLDEETGDEQTVRLEVISDAHAIVRGEVTLSQPGMYRMRTWQMGPEIEMGHVQAIEPGAGDVISALRNTPEAPELAVACSGEGAANEVITEILADSFAEPLLEVAAGTTVTWANTSIVPHQVVFDNLAFDSSVMLHQDDTFSVTFTDAGEFGYYCGPHPFMKGIVRVDGNDG